MKKFYLFLLTILTTLLISSSIFADDAIYIDGYFFYTIKNNEITIIKYSGNETSIKVPMAIGDYYVTEIAEGTFENNNIEEIKIPDTVTKIGKDILGNSNIECKYYDAQDEIQDDKPSIEVGEIKTDPVGFNLTYNGKEQVLIKPGEANHLGKIYYKLDNGKYSTLLPSAKDAKSYTITYYLSGDATHLDSSEKTIYASINKADINVEYKNQTYAYSGIGQGEGVKATCVDGTTPTILYGISKNQYTSSSPILRSQEGTTTVYFKITANNHNDYEGSYTITINKKDSIYTNKPSSKSLVYTGKSQELINAGYSIDGNLLYSLDNKNFSYSIPSASNAGNYTVYYYIEGDNNHNDSKVESINVTIASAKMDTSISNVSFSYDGNSHFHEVSTSILDATIKYGTSSNNINLTSAPKFTDVGEYKVYYSISAKNYETVTGYYTLTISKTKGIINSLPVANTSLTYTGSSISLISKGKSNDGTILYKLNNGSYSTNIPTVIDAGNYTVYYYLKGDNNHLDSIEYSINITVSKAKLNINAGNQNYVYDGKNHSSDIKVETINNQKATIKYGTSSNNYNLDSSPSYKDVGTYTVYYKVSANNHEDVLGSYNVIISKADSSSVSYIAPSIKDNLIYTGKALKLINAGSTNDGTIKYRLNNGTYSTNIPTAINAGEYTVYYKVFGDNNHSDTQEEKITVNIQKANMTINISDQEYGYDGSSHGQGVIASTVDGSKANILYSFNSSSYTITQAPTYIEAGNYVVYYKVTSDNHNDVTGSYKIAIKDLGYSIIHPSAKILTYNGTSQELLNEGKTSFSKFEYKLEGSSYSSKIPTGLKAGEYIVYYRLNSDEDHEGVLETKVIVKIMEATIDVTSYNQEYNFDNTLHGEGIIANSVDSSEVTIKYSLDGNNYNSDEPFKYSEIGTYTIYYKVTCENHSDYYGSYTISIHENSLDNSIIETDEVDDLTFDSNDDVSTDDGVNVANTPLIATVISLLVVVAIFFYIRRKK